MVTSRLARRSVARSRQRRMTLVGAGLLLAIALVAVLVGLAIGTLSPSGRAPSATSATGDAVTVLGGATAESTSSASSPAGSTDVTSTGLEASAPTAVASEQTPQFVVCIDPGHQAKANLDGEPIGPGASETKPKVTGGATGTVTGQPEHEFVLAVSVLLAERLEAAGVRVILTRSTANVDISNSERAALANEAKADLFVRVHADGNSNGDVRGASTLYPDGNDWVRPIASESKAAALAIHSAVLGVTKASDRGVVQRSDLSGFNWCTVPAVLVECGFLSNPAEDRLLATGAYRAKLADGIAQGILGYLKNR